MTNEDLYCMGLFRICETLHQAWTGAADPLDAYQEAKYLEYLKHRMVTWNRGLLSPFDSAVYSLVVATLFERGESVS